ncbi:MAG: ZIP family metal transporter [Ignavibacteriaceae bacterium]|nr:ZIP family metal transporter [Ignavibacteriaceae bacterium]
MFPDIIIKSSIAVISSVLGALLLFFIKLDHKKLCSLISFSAGALLGAAGFALIPESFHNLSAYHRYSLVELIFGVISGYGLFWFITKYYSHVCPACSASHFDEQTTKKFSEIVLTLLTALSIHSFLDGMAISSGGVDLGRGNNSIFIAIATHKFPEGLALAALMFSSNYKKGKILLYVVLVEMVTILGAVAGTYIFRSNISPVLLGIIMAHIAGGFIFLAIHAVFGEMLKNHKNLVLISFGTGLLLILSVYLMLD